MILGEALERVQVPVLLQTGWQDLFLAQTLEQYDRLSARGVDVALTVGPVDTHRVVTKGGRIVVRESLDWLGEHLAGTGIRTRAAPVKVFVTGADQWRDLPHWPPPTTDGRSTSSRAAVSATSVHQRAARRSSPTTPPTRLRRSADASSIAEAATPTTARSPSVATSWCSPVRL